MATVAIGNACFESIPDKWLQVLLHGRELCILEGIQS